MIRLKKEIQYGESVYKAGEVIEPTPELYKKAKEEDAIDEEVNSYEEAGLNKLKSERSPDYRTRKK